MNQLSFIDNIHERYARPRRVRVLAHLLTEIIPACEEVLDVGCGDGQLAAALSQQRPQLHLTGIDVLSRKRTYIPVREFDGQTIPYPDKSFDVLLLVDVLHHAADPIVLLRECTRVARAAVVIKDHACQGLLARPTLALMDYVGNKRHGVNLTYNYWTLRRWQDVFESLGLEVGEWRSDLKLYPRMFDWVFGRGLHFIARIDMGSAKD